MPFPQEFELDNLTFLWITELEVFISHAASLVGSWLLMCCSALQLGSFGSLLASIGWALASYSRVISSSLNLAPHAFLFVGQTGLCGIGYGLMYMAVIAAVPVTFPDPGLAMGFVTAGSALGQVVAGPVLEFYRTHYGWATSYRSRSTFV